MKCVYFIGLLCLCAYVQAGKWMDEDEKTRRVLCTYGYTLEEQPPRNEDEMRNCMATGSIRGEPDDVTSPTQAPNMNDIMAGALTKEKQTRADRLVARFREYMGEGDKPLRQLVEERRRGCGVPDYGDGLSNGLVKVISRRRRRFNLHGSRWNKREVTWSIIRYPGRYNTPQRRELIDSLLARSFRHWSNVANINFRRVSPRVFADITILWARGNHGDRNPFDGPSGTLAHAYFPRFGGDAHFDDDERWTDHTDGRPVTDVEQVATHEIGHSLGLLHTRVRSAVMHASYRYRRDFALHSDDRAGIQQLYGARRTPNPPATPTPRPPVVTPRPPVVTPRPPVSTHDWCRDPSFDAFTQLFDGELYIFKGSYYYKYLNSRSRVENRRRPITDFEGLTMTSRIASVLYVDEQPQQRKMLFIFTKDNRYIKYYSRTSTARHRFPAEQDYPRYVDPNENTRRENRRVGWDYIQVAPDAAFVDAKTGYIALMPRTKGFFLYVFGRGMYPRSSRGYSMSYWRGLPRDGSITSGLKYTNRRSYVFTRNNMYYRLSPLSYSVDTRSDGKKYPLPTSQFWFGCRSQNVVEQPEVTADLSNFVKVTDGNIEDNSALVDMKMVEEKEGTSGQPSVHTSVLSIVSTVTMLITSLTIFS